MAMEALPPRRFDMGAILRDAAIAAAVALALALPLIGVQTIEIDGAIGIRTRFDAVAIGVAAVFLGRLLLKLAWTGIAERLGRIGSRAGAQAAAVVRDHSAISVLLVLLFAVALPFLPFSSPYLVGVATFVLIYVMLGWGLNVVVGFAGLLDLGYVAFYAVGAYSFALLALWFGFSFWQALPPAGLFAAFFGFVLGFPVLRLRGDYLAIVTLGFGEIIHTILQNWVPVTNGPAGILNIPAPTLFGLVFQARARSGATTFHEFFHLPFHPAQRVIFAYYIILVLALLTNLFTLRLRKLPIGRAWEALREDEIACRALGINPTTVKLSAFAIGAMIGGLAGAFFAAKQNFISPESFTFAESAGILAIVVLGGMGNPLGVVPAAILLVSLTELRELAQYRMLFFGAAMVAIMVWRPRGLLAHRAPSLRLWRDRRERA